MLPEPKKIKVAVGNQEITFETGRVARQANGSVIVQTGDTVVFAAACASKGPKECDFFPLTVNYQEKFSSTGKTLGGFIKREGRPTEKETLICRLIDRPIRPLFPEGYYNEVQVTASVLSYDADHTPDVLGLCAASAALVLSDIPFAKPVGAVRVGYIDNQFVINPSNKEQENSTLDLVLAGTADAVLMIEGYCDFLTEDQVVEAIETGHEAIRGICLALQSWRDEIGKEKVIGELRLPSDELKEEVAKIARPLLEEAVRIASKQEREEAISAAKQAVWDALVPEDEEANPKNAKYDVRNVATAFKKLSASILRRIVLEEKVRTDGRSLTQVRPITIEQAVLPRTHGSSLFTRGETQALAVCTLGGETMAQRYETIDTDGARRFYLQYFFPPYSVGEVGRSGPPGRREVGHGKLAERALQTVLPNKEAFPYVIRLESNITESNGSSSMASVCGGCLAMMDAGVPIDRPVSGIAMGLVLEGDRYVILSDILGIEDALGDMDFKVTGDEAGVTAFQMDIKVEGITPAIMKAALAQAKEGRVHILGEMQKACPKYRADLVAHAPRIEIIKVNPSKINVVIGPGGKQIRAIIEETGVNINIEDDGSVELSGDFEGMERAKAIITGLTAEVEIGQIYEGRITSVVPFGIFVEVLPGKEGLCHISELNDKRVEDIFSFIKEGEIVKVKVLDINERGQLKLSRKALLTADAHK